jgi:apolipoprotein N-acyltransferase
VTQPHGVKSAPLWLAAAGALQTLAFVFTWAWLLPLLATAGLAWAAARSTSRQAALLGWAFGTGWLVAGTGWLYISMHRYGDLPALLAAAAVLALSAALSLYLAGALWLYARWHQRHVMVDAALFAALWLVAELARGVIFTGFPWVASGYAQVDGPLAPLAPWVGVYGVGAVGALAAALAAHSTHQRGWPLVLAALVVTAPALLGVVPFSTPAGSIAVTLLQTNIAQDEKFAAERMPEALAWVTKALSASRSELTVAPETAVPLLPAQLEDVAPGYWQALEQRFAVPGQAALVGVPFGDFETGYTNSVAGLSAAPAYRYDKQHLVPFGEFIPRGFRWFTEAMNIPLGDFNRGALNPPSFSTAGQRVAPNICYEDLFGEELAARFADPFNAPTLFANLSNLGWFDDSVAIPQHLAISRFRALEFQRPMVRATNTGATAIIDHRGMVAAQLQPRTRGVLEGRVEGRDGITPFAWWAARFSLWPLLLLALAVLGVARTLAAWLPEPPP